jgi:hypothetical protein
MQVALFLATALVVFLVVLNGFLNGSLKQHTDAALSVVWLALLAACFLAFGWKSGCVLIAFSFIGAGLIRPAAARVARFVYAHPPR